MPILRQDIERLRSELQTLPDPDTSKRRVTLAETIRALAPEIRGLLDRGYEWPQIADALQQRGVTTTEKSLRVRFYAAEREARTADESRPTQRRSSTRRAPRNGARSTRSSDAAPPSAPAGSPAVTAAVTINDTASETSSTRPATPPGTFVPRPDRTTL